MLCDQSQILDGFFESPHDRPPTILVMLTGYFDESGHESNRHVFIAGFVGDNHQWSRCADEWREALGRRAGLHMRKLRWSNPRIPLLLRQLAPIPRQCSLEPVMGGVLVSDYEDLVKGTPWDKLSKGYFLALYPLIIQLLRWVPAEERIELIFDQQEHYEPLARKILETATTMEEFINKDGLPKLAKWSYVPRNSTMLTQPSDYYAFALAQHYKDRNSKKAQWSSPILHEHPAPIGSIWTREQVRENTQYVHERMNEQWPNQKPIPLRGWNKRV